MNKPTLSSLGFDHLTDEEAKALGAYEQLCLLTEIAREIKRLSDEKNNAIDLRTEAEFLYIDNASKENKKLFTQAKAVVQKLDAMIKARNRQHSSLQTTIRATP